MAERAKDFIPAAGSDWLLPLYDPFERVFGNGRDKERLLRQADLAPGMRVLDVGCGTGTLAIRARCLHPGAEVVGVDPDPKALDLARRKARRRGAEVDFRQAYAQEIPWPDAAFDVVLCSMMLHHLERDVKRATFAEVRRLLRPGGRFHALDFGPPRGPATRMLARLLRRHAAIADNLDGRIPDLMREAGLGAVEETGSATRPFGSLAYWRAAAT